jgi:hypothetical protein|tara:strand:+ start:38 stop:391 length:354 start_codon:yes stop_codon:yes gene_type:complete
MKGKYDMKRSKPDATRLDEDWQPSPTYITKISNKHPGLDLESEFIKFQEYYINLTTAKAYKVNWNLTFQKWCINADKWQKEELANKKSTSQTGDEQREALNRAFTSIQNSPVSKYIN